MAGKSPSKNEGLDLGKIKRRDHEGSLLSVIQPPETYPEMAKSHESWTAYDCQKVAIEQVQ